jgi:hypothetical protein
MITFRIDVDYPYDSRSISALFVALNNTRQADGYLNNAKTIATMINLSKKEVKAYWFFTPYTFPDTTFKVLTMNKDIHELGLHVINHPYGELITLENAIQSKIRYYTVHGTVSRIARFIWKRKRCQISIPPEFPLKSFHNFRTYSLDVLCRAKTIEEVKAIVDDAIHKNIVLEIHPDWLFDSNKNRGAYYEILCYILEVNGV